VPTSTNPHFLQAGCPSCRPANSVRALKAEALKAELFKVISKYSRPHYDKFPNMIPEYINVVSLLTCLDFSTLLSESSSYTFKTNTITESIHRGT